MKQGRVESTEVGLGMGVGGTYTLEVAKQPMDIFSAVMQEALSLHFSKTISATPINLNGRHYFSMHFPASTRRGSGTQLYIFHRFYRTSGGSYELNEIPHPS